MGLTQSIGMSTASSHDSAFTGFGAAAGAVAGVLGACALGARASAVADADADAPVPAPAPAAGSACACANGTGDGDGAGSSCTAAEGETTAFQEMRALRPTHATWRGGEERPGERDAVRG